MTFPRRTLLVVALCGYFVRAVCAINTDEVKETPNEQVYKVHQKRSFTSVDPFSDVAAAAVSGPAFLSDHLYEPVSSEDEQIRAEIEATYNKVLTQNKFIKFLDEHALMDLPVGIKSDIGALSYTILIDSVQAFPSHSLLYASMMFDAPRLGNIHFRGVGIKFSKEGGIVDGGILELVGDYPFTKEEAKTQFIIHGDGKTFVEFDCNGFRQFSIDASLLFSRDLLQREDENGRLLENENVSVNFTTSVGDWNDLLVEVSIPPFRVKGINGVSFEVEGALLDWSDTRNVPGVNFPVDYTQESPVFLSGNSNLWRGVYIRTMRINLPPEFNTPDQTGTPSRVSFAGYDLVIDDEGFSGGLAAENLIPIDRGKLGNWNFSLEAFEVSIVSNELRSAGFKGKIDIPINSKEGGTSVDSRLFAYTAMMRPGGNYLFNVSNPNELNFDLWKAAEVTLDASSYVEIEVKNGKFLPRANLNGKMDINIGMNGEDGAPSDNEKKNLKMAQVTFQNLQVQTVKPYVTIGAFSLGSNSGIGGFGFTINNIYGGQNSNELFLGVDMTLQLTGNEGGAFGAKGGFRVVSKAVERGSDLSYKYDRIEISQLGINIDKGTFKFEGKLNFFKEDLVYGNGISGYVDATFGSIGLTANAIFGNVDGYKYWYVDAMATLGTTAPVFPGFFINRFGGGAYYHMSIDSKRVGSQLGTTTSGMTYVPNQSMGLGLKAIVGVMGAKETVFAGEATYEMAFRSSGGLKYIRFIGNATLLSNPAGLDISGLQDKVKALAEKAKDKQEISGNNQIAKQIFGDSRNGAAIYGELNMELNFDNNSLHANLMLDVNVAAGLIKGGGNAVMHFEPGQWYIYIGRPERENRFAMEFLGLMRADAYFVMGSVIPDSPPPPAEVSEILGGMDLDYMQNLNQLADGAGIGFGASFGIDTGDKTFLIFYGHFKVGVGFDVMLKDYGNTTCSGSGQIGISGWYANGQAYAYFDGLIGIKVKVFGKAKKIDILSIAAAVVMQAQLPNPVWMKGIVGGRFSVLGGLVKGECKFEVEIGNQCDMKREERDSDSAVEGMQVIAQLNPGSGTTDVDVFTLPQVVFNYEMDKEFKMNDGGEQIRFKITADKVELKQGGAVIAADLEWSEDKMTAVLKPSDILPSKTQLTLTVSSSFKEFRGGTWQVVSAEGQPLTESQSITFTTGEAPDYIPDNNIEYIYPLLDMVNYYPEEYPHGFIKLKQGQAYLFEDADYTPMVRFSSGGNVQEVPLQYVRNKKEVNFDIPTDLARKSVYTMHLVNVPKQETNIESNITVSTKTLDLGKGASTEIRSRAAEGTVKNYEEQRVFESYFRVSQYASFASKAEATLGRGGWRDPIQVGVHRIGTNLSGPEPFAHRELKVVNGEAPLIQIEADLTDNAWYQNKIYPLIYEGYPLGGRIKLSASNRDPSELGIVPTKATYIWQYPYSITLSQDAKNSGSSSLNAPEGTFSYLLAKYMYGDYVDLSNQVASQYASGNLSSRLANLLESQFPTIQKGDYWSIAKYVIPGINEVSSTYRHKIYNPLE